MRGWGSAWHSDLLRDEADEGAEAPDIVVVVRGGKVTGVYAQQAQLIVEVVTDRDWFKTRYMHRVEEVK